MAQVKEQNPAQAQNNPNRNSESGGEKRTRTRRPYYNRRPRRTQQSSLIFCLGVISTNLVLPARPNSSSFSG